MFSGLTYGEYVLNVAGATHQDLPGLPDLVGASDTGNRSNDNITKLNNASPSARLQFSVPDTEAGSTVTFMPTDVGRDSLRDGRDHARQTTDGSTKIPDGNAKITARKTRPGQPPADVGDSQPLTVTIDTVAPQRPRRGRGSPAIREAIGRTALTNDTTPDLLLTYDSFAGLSRRKQVSVDYLECGLRDGAARGRHVRVRDVARRLKRATSPPSATRRL